MKKEFLTVVVVAGTSLLAALTSCSSDKTEEDGQTEYVIDMRDIHPIENINLTQEQKELTRSCNDFAFNLLRSIDRHEGDGKNRFVSPIGVGYVLGMLHAGAADETRQQINQVAGWQGMTPEMVNFYYQKMSEGLPKVDKSVALRIANAIYLNSASGYRLQSDFQNAMQTYYRAQLKTLDYTKPASLNEINNWCSQQTDNMIPKALDNLDPKAVSTLINAIYFKATWTDRFDPKDTKDMPFTCSDGSTLTLPMMHRLGLIRYAENDLFRMIRLPYGNDGWSMRVLLPAEGKTVDDIVENLKADSFDKNQLNDYGSVKVDILLPRFVNDSKMDLRSVLSQMGMARAFDTKNAQFPHVVQLSPGEVFYISKMFQKARVEVNEEGTSMVAVTVAHGGATSAMPITFHANQPFVYIVSESSTDAICFIGKYCGQ